MQTKQFTITINAGRNVVWKVLWDDKTYREWTSPFYEGSYAKSDWKEGSEIHFLGPNGSGMYATIEKKDEPNTIVFSHTGEIKEGEKMPASKWAGSKEKYILTDKEGRTELMIEIDIVEEYLDYFEETWPKALQKLKELAEAEKNILITIEANINATVDKVWKYFNEPEHVTKWNSASEDWHTPIANNDLKVGGRFTYRMEAKDKSWGFDFGGTYDTVTTNECIEYTLDDKRKVTVSFISNGNETKIVETFEAENTYAVEFQKAGWQSILNSFKAYTESN